MTDLRTNFYLAVNIFSTDNLNDFFAIKQPCEPLKDFDTLKSFSFTNYNCIYTENVKVCRRFQNFSVIRHNRL